MNESDEQFAMRLREVKDTVVLSYKMLLDASDAFADCVGYDSDCVLGRVLPKSAQQRRDLDRLSHDMAVIEQDGLQAFKVRCRIKRRKELIASLNLSDSDRELLFGDNS